MQDWGETAAWVAVAAVVAVAAFVAVGSVVDVAVEVGNAWAVWVMYAHAVCMASSPDVCASAVGDAVFSPPDMSDANIQQNPKINKTVNAKGRVCFLFGSVRNLSMGYETIFMTPSNIAAGIPERQPGDFFCCNM
jgi:hypothetical protein